MNEFELNWTETWLPAIPHYILTHIAALETHLYNMSLAL